LDLINLNFILRIAAVLLGIMLARKYSKKRVAPRTALIQALIILILGGVLFGFGTTGRESLLLILVVDFVIPFTAGWFFGRHEKIPRKSRNNRERNNSDPREEGD